MSYYMKLKPIVLSYVKAYQTDFTKHDKKDLRHAKRILLAMRESGTNLYVFDKDCDCKRCMVAHGQTPKNMHECEVQNIEIHRKNALLWMTSMNTRFIYGENGEIKEITKDEAVNLLETMTEPGWLYA